MLYELENQISQFVEDDFLILNKLVFIKEYGLFHKELDHILNYFHVLPGSVECKLTNGLFIPEFNGEIMVSSNGYGYGDNGYFFALVDKFQLAIFINLYFWMTRRDYHYELDHVSELNVANVVIQHIESYIKLNEINIVDCILKDI